LQTSREAEGEAVQGSESFLMVGYIFFEVSLTSLFGRANALRVSWFGLD